MSFFDPQNRPLPPGYPLAPVDANGQTLAAGDLVRIGVIPDWLTHDLPIDEVKLLRACEQTTLRILEIDVFGCVWFGDGSPWFCLKPADWCGSSYTA